MLLTQKNITVFILLSLMMAKMLGMPIVWLTYSLNKDYIAAQLCENKSLPQMHCNGQCVLMKKLARVNESNESKETKTDVKSIGVDFIEEPHQFIVDNIFITHTFHYALPQVYFPAPFVENIFHPPAVIC